MKKVFRYRVYPTKRQTMILNQTLDGCRWLYNHLLEQRKNTWETEKKNLSCYDQINSFDQLKQDNPFLGGIHSQVLQNIAGRIDLAFKSFYRRIKKSEKPGYPRFRGKFRYDSFCYPQSGFKLLKNVVQLSKIGGVRINLHRPIEGTIKTCTIKKTPTGKWFVSFSCKIEHTPIQQPVKPIIGIDVGLESFITLSSGIRYKNPRFFRQEEKALAKVQRKLSKQKKGTPVRTRVRKTVARVHERISNKRHNFIHQKSYKIVNRFNTIVVENLNIGEMKKNNHRCINRGIGDVAWRMFLNTVRYKAEYAGKRVIKVNPAYTSQTCSGCGTRIKLKLSDRIFHCPSCGLYIHRDYNASINILSLGLQTLGIFPRSPVTCDGE